MTSAVSSIERPPEETQFNDTALARIGTVQTQQRIVEGDQVEIPLLGAYGRVVRAKAGWPIHPLSAGGYRVVHQNVAMTRTRCRKVRSALQSTPS